MVCCSKKCLSVPARTSCESSALLFLRLVMGIAFILHGWGKIQHPFNWMGDAPVPALFQFLAAFSEFGGGIALVIGLLAPLASLGIAFTMGVAVYMHAIVRQDPFVAMKGGSSYELALVYLAIALLIIAAGPGKYSLDSKFFGTRE